jgi:hypothetical protein
VNFTLPPPGTVFNSFTLLYTGGGTATYNRV